MTLDIDTLRSLPAGAEYSAADGRLRVTVKSTGNNIVVEAKTDSIERKTTTTKAESYISESNSSARSVEIIAAPPSKIKNNLKRFLNIFLAGAIAGIVALLILKKRFI